MGTITILHENCDPKLADDKSLPYTAYLVEYTDGEKTFYDITMCNKKVDLFDHYYDTYNKNFVGFKQSEGRVSPKLYGYKSQGEKKSK